MLICHCRRVNDRSIRAAALAGAKSCEEVGAACGAGTGCGGCRPAIARLLQSEDEGSRAEHRLPMARNAPTR